LGALQTLTADANSEKFPKGSKYEWEPATGEIMDRGIKISKRTGGTDQAPTYAAPEATRAVLTGLIPTSSLAEFEKEMNAIIWTSANASTKNFKKGFDLTDSNSDKKIDRKEDMAANLLAAKFKTLDKYKLDNGAPNNRPDVGSDKKLDTWELNHKYPMWEVANLLDTYSSATEKNFLDVLEYAQSQNAKLSADDKCTISELSLETKDLKQCSTLTECSSNSDCPKAYESCGEFFYKDQPSSDMTKKCIPTVYCGSNRSNADSLVFNNKKIFGKVSCAEAKEDVSGKKKPEVVYPATLKLLNKGHKCKAKGSNIPSSATAPVTTGFTANEVIASNMNYNYNWGKKAEECHTRAKEVQKAGTCNFFMHSDDYPVEGCYCCDLYEPVADTDYNYNIF